jgi:hypothetical protein
MFCTLLVRLYTCYKSKYGGSLSDHIISISRQQSLKALSSHNINPTIILNSPVIRANGLSVNFIINLNIIFNL